MTTYEIGTSFQIELQKNNICKIMIFKPFIRYIVYTEVI